LKGKIMAAEDLISAVESAGTTRILNCLPSRDPEDDWKLPNAVASGLIAAEATIPDSKDFRDDSWWSIGDQGATGSCVGWALADSVLRWHFTQGGRLRSDERMSPRFLWMAAKETDEFSSEPSTFIERAGTSLKAALEVARRYGSVRDIILPFTRLFDGDVNTFYSIAAQLKVAAYFNLGRTLADWRTWLAGNGPVITRLSVDATWDQATQTNGNLDVYQAGTARGGHAVAFVGYRPNGFIVRNSWGTGWGDRGYGYASDNYAAQAFTEAYGVTVIGGGRQHPTPRVWHR
jgi:C1A family cysteine protease